MNIGIYDGDEKARSRHNSIIIAAKKAYIDKEEPFAALDINVHFSADKRP